MRSIRLVLSLALAGAALAAVPTLQNTAVGQPAAARSQSDPSLLDRMRSEASGRVQLAKQRATGKVGFVRTTGDLLPGRDGASRTAAAAKATAYLRTYAAAFGAAPGELRRAGVTGDRYGWTIAYTQRYRGVPVFGAKLLANVDRSGHLRSVNGYAADDLRLSVTPRVSRAEAGRHAVALVRQQPPTDSTGAAGSTAGIRAVSASLLVYRMGSVKGESGKAVLAYQVEVTNKSNVRDVVFIDAQTGKPVNRYSLSNDALNRLLKEAGGRTDPTTFVDVWKEGDPFPGTLNADQQREVVGTGLAYWLFKDTFDRDSYDGAGAQMITVNNDGRINCPNANWNSVTTNYCDGVTSDDVVAHEWGHAYTEKTSGLIYQWQPGALNESYSDVWGETVDLIDGIQDEGEGDITTKRPDGLCSTFTRSPIEAIINAPAAIAGPCAGAAPASFGPVITKAGVTSDLVISQDPADAAGALTTDACSPLTNASAVAGKFAYVDRGTCTFNVKATNVQNAGATGMIVGNNSPAAPISMSGGQQLTIYGAMVTQADGVKIKGASGTVNITVRVPASAPATADSYRWLIGEKSAAFGGAIRDMWQPTCYGMAGKVSDAQYVCSTADSGGVHSNSGVPNHAYALTVDGGTYNGVTMSGLGLDKAANLWFYNQTHFLTPTSGFPEFADGLQASCAALTGQPIKKVTLQPNVPSPAATPITAADCQQVANVISATQLRTPPTQCNFQPLYGQSPPATCGPGSKADVVFADNFENGLGSWTASQVVKYPGGNGLPWTTTSTLTGTSGHSSKVAFAPAPAAGVCSGGAGDISSRDSITSPAIGMPNSISGGKLTFDQAIVSEVGVDGGNLKVSVNGNPFTLVPTAAYAYNGPNTTLLTAAAGNTNPLAGEVAFSGSDGGAVTTTWGTTVVDLAAAGIHAGDVVQFRFDMGRDGCGGLFGWYVDNVSVTVCKQATKVTAVHQPEPSTFGSASSVKVTVARDGNVGSAPSGNVTLVDPAGNQVASGPLVDGAATLPLPATYPVGAHTLVAKYAGTDVLSAAQAPVRVTVVGAGQTKRATDTSAKGPKKDPRYKQNFDLKVAVSASGPKPTGEVVVKYQGEEIGTGVLRNGKVTIIIKKNLKVGKHQLVVRYLGSSSTLPSKDKVTIKVVEKKKKKKKKS